MEDQLLYLRTLLSNDGDSNLDSKREFIQGLNQVPVPLVGPWLHQIVTHVESPVLDHMLIEVLKGRLNTDESLLVELGNFIEKKGSNTTFFYVLLQVLDDYTKDFSDRRKLWTPILERITLNEERPVELCAKAFKRLQPKPDNFSIQILNKFLNSGNPVLVEAGCFVLGIWQDESLPSDVDYKTIVSFAKHNTSLAKQLPSVLNLLSTIKNKEVYNILEKIINAAKGSERVRILNVISDRIPVSLLILLVENAIEDWDQGTEIALQALVYNNRNLLSELYSQRAFRAYLYACSLNYYLLTDIEIININKLKESESPIISYQAQKAVRIASKLTGVDKQISTYTGNLRNLAKNFIESSQLPLDIPLAGVVEEGFNAELHKADALYVDLGFGFNIAGQHWHTGLYIGFSVSPNGRIGMMSIVEAGRIGSTSTNLLDFDCMQLIPVSRSFESPEISIRDTMQALRDNLISAFIDFNGSLVYHGPRRTPGLTAAIAERIVSTAVTFLDRGINYTADNMINKKSFFNEWMGTVNDIGATRCDGVIEFSYETHNQIVCRGISNSRRNISRSGNRSLDNHNDLHLASLGNGELCPRVQAGDQGDNDHLQASPNSRMTSAEEPQIPGIGDFSISPFFLRVFPPIITFKVESNRYDTAYVRITVSKNGGPFKFVITEARQTEQSIDATWRFELVPTNADLAAIWQGGAAGQSNAGLEAGLYEFRLVAVDLGGNVSQLKQFFLNVE